MYVQIYMYIFEKNTLLGAIAALKNRVQINFLKLYHEKFLYNFILFGVTQMCTRKFCLL